MILQKYDSYKDSGAEWLGEIPEGWEFNRVKKTFIEKKILSTNGDELLLTVSHITGVTPRDEKEVNMFLADDTTGYKLCSEGDLIINTMWAWMGALGISINKGVCSPGYNVYKIVKKNKFHSNFFEYLFKTPNFIKEIIKHSKGIRPSRLRLYPRYLYMINC